MSIDAENDAASPLVSVIITCFNQAHFLGEAIESALAQTHPRVEVVVVDDGSTDTTREVTQRYPSVSYVRQENRGLATARNTGLAESKGRYLVFLDADDRLLPRALETGLSRFRRHPECAFVSGGHHRIDPRGSVISRPTPAQVVNDHYLALLRANYVGMHAAVMYARTALEQSGGFDASLPACEDYDLYLRLARTHPVCHHLELVAEYRTHDASMSSNNARMLAAALAVLRRQRRYRKADPRREEAYSEGARYWRELYAVPLTNEVLRSLGRGQLASAARGLPTLLRLAPATLLRKLAVRAASVLIPPAWFAFLLRRLGKPYYPRVGHIRYGDLRRLDPISPRLAFDRGLPIDRYYIERFLGRRAEDIRGRVLEIGDAEYTRRFGEGRVTRSDVLHVCEGNPEATFVGDLAHADHVPADTFDCVVLTQTLQYVFELQAALRTIHRILKPGGVLLLTVPGVTQISQDQWRDSWLWSFTSLSVRRLLAEAFPAGSVDVEAHGNVLAATGFLQGIAAEELEPSELDHRDAQYELLVTARAVKAPPQP